MKPHVRFLLLIPLLAAACSRNAAPGSPEHLQAVAQTVLDKQQYTAWFDSKENHQRREETFGDKTYRVMHLPAALLALREVGAAAPDTARKAAEEHYSDLEYFRLEISGTANGSELLKSGAVDASEYNRRLTYSSFGMQKDLSIVTSSGASIPCAIFQFERSFDVAPVARFLIAFDKAQLATAEKFSFVLDDRLFGNGLIKFPYTKEELQSTPQLH